MELSDKKLRYSFIKFSCGLSFILSHTYMYLRYCDLAERVGNCYLALSGTLTPY